MSYDGAVFAWAESRLNLPKGSVIRVDFGTQDEGYCETCSYTVGGADVAYTSKNTRKGAKNPLTTKYDFINLGGESFAEILHEILEAGK